MPTTTMPTHKNDAFLNFLSIFSQTGNPNHAALESGWIDHTADPEPYSGGTINLLLIKATEHEQFFHESIRVPSEIQNYIDNATSLTQHEIDNLEIGMEKHHQINTDIHCIVWQPEIPHFTLLPNA